MGVRSSSYYKLRTQFVSVTRTKSPMWPNSVFVSSWQMLHPWKAKTASLSCEMTIHNVGNHSSTFSFCSLDMEKQIHYYMLFPLGPRDHRH